MYYEHWTEERKYFYVSQMSSYLGFSYSLTFFFMTLIHSESLLYIENGFPKNSLYAALLPLPPPHYTHNHLHVFKVMMHEFLQTSFVSYIYLDIQWNVHIYVQFKNYSRITKNEVCHIYKLKHIKHKKICDYDQSSF